MPHLVLDGLNQSAPWSALAPDGVTPSTELTLSDVATPVRFGADGRSALITATSQAVGHVLRRTRPPLDLTPFDELRLWVWGSRGTRPATREPQLLEMRLGSALMGLDDPANTWHRRIPFFAGGRWFLVRLSLDDLAPAVAGAVDRIEFACVASPVPWQCFLDDLLAVRPSFLVDVDTAMRDRLHQQISVQGNLVSAEVIGVGETPALAAPALRIWHYALRLPPKREGSARHQGDFTSDGYHRVQGELQAFDVCYAVEAHAQSRDDQARLLDFVLAALPRRGELVVNAVPIPMRMVAEPPDDLPLLGVARRILLCYEIYGQQEQGSAQLVRAVDEVVLEIGSGAPS
jgi:hypothetical protein